MNAADEHAPSTGHASFSMTTPYRTALDVHGLEHALDRLAENVSETGP